MEQPGGGQVPGKRGSDSGSLAQDVTVNWQASKSLRTFKVYKKKQN